MNTPKDIVVHFAHQFEEKTGFKMTINWTKDCSIAKRLLNTDESDTLKRLIDIFFQTETPERYSFPFFAGSINSVKGRAAKQNVELKEDKLISFDRHGNAKLN